MSGCTGGFVSVLFQSNKIKFSEKETHSNGRQNLFSMEMSFDT